LSYSKRTLLIVLLATGLVSGLVVLSSHCPESGIAFTRNRRALHRLKNRTELPQEIDFDSRVTLARLLQVGEDRARWSMSRAASVEG